MTCTVPASPARLTPSMHSDVGLEDYFAQANATDTGVQSHVFSVVFCSMRNATGLLTVSCACPVPLSWRAHVYTGLRPHSSSLRVLRVIYF